MVHLRLATPEDMPAVERVLGADQAFFYQKRLLQGAFVLSAWRGDEPIAAICLSFGRPEERQIAERLPDVPMLYRLHVKEDQRNRGVGTRLLQWAEREVADRGHRSIALGVDIENKRAMRLYRRLGYAEWEFGVIDTVLETYSEDGPPQSLPDRCLIFVKEVG